MEARNEQGEECAPDSCYFSEILKIKSGCPYVALERDPNLARLNAFLSRTMESYPTEDKFDKKKKINKYSVSLEKFNWACTMFGVEPRNQLEASLWSSIAVKAANEAQDIAVVQERAKRWKDKKVQKKKQKFQV